ncbi:hypothetical protein JST97_26565 [bacterium]|nr:hypothetical protein [bacterium]
MNIRESNLEQLRFPIFWQPAQPALEPLATWDDDYQPDLEGDDEEGLFDEPALQQLTQNWAPERPAGPPPNRHRPAESFPATNRPISHRPAQAPKRPAAPTAPAAAASQARPAAPSGGARLNLPPRPEGALTGKQFLESTKGMSRSQREAAILSEIQKGNVPEFARQMKEIQLQSNGHSGTLRVMPDYLAIGSDQDFVRIPMDPKTAQKIADQTGTSLPTTKMVDDIYKQADNKLTPQPLPPGAQMMSNDYYQRHNNMVEQQMTQRGAEHGALTAGHQKDLVISNRLTQHPDRVAIYGWHQPNGKPIQSLSTVHENTYADYSHGVRLVGGTMLVDGQERPVSEVLRDPQLAGLISSEGAIRDPRVPGV